MSAQGNGLKGQRLGENGTPISNALKGQYKYLNKVDAVKKYIANQKEHHKTQTFEDEYIQFLKENDVEYNDDYLWT